MLRSVLLALTLLLPAWPAFGQEDAETFFELKVRPVLAGTCFPCHGGKKTENGLKVDSRESLLKGGDRGPAMIVGDISNAANPFWALTPGWTLWPMLVLRTAVLIVSGAQQAALDPDNAYVTDQTGGEIAMFEQATSLPIDATIVIGDVTGRKESGDRGRGGVRCDLDIA